jgi:hypothetical protein
MGLVKLRWTGIGVGAVLSVLPLLPWLAAVRAEPEMLPIEEGFVGRGLLVFSPLRGASYWVRYGTFHLPNKETRFDFTTVLDSGAAAEAARRLGDVVVKGVGPAMFVAAAAVNLWLWRRWRRRGRRRMLAAGASARQWTLAYLRVTFLGSLVVYALAPTTVMWWQPVPLLHAAALTLTLAVGALARVRPRPVAAGMRAWAALAVVFVVLLAFGGPRHRCGGRSNIVIPLRHDHPMLHDLGIHASCRVPIQPDGWWPDVLPEPKDQELPR